jgi:hypothetical protein
MKVYALTMLVFLALLSACKEQSPNPKNPDENAGAQQADITFTINGKTVRPDKDEGNGTVSLFAVATGDMNDDGLDDRAVILRHNSHGSGTFYYLNVFLKEDNSGWRFAGEDFLGDRIKFSYTQIYAEGSIAPDSDTPAHPDDYGTLVIAYYVHSKQPLSEPPKFYITRHWVVIDGKLMAQDAY